jgi:hypothetical protein
MMTVRKVAFSAPIWKTALDAGKGWLALELRDADALQVEFAVVDLEDAAVVSSGIRLPERWWLSLENAQNGLLFISEISSKIDSKLEGRKWVIEVQTGHLLDDVLTAEYRENTFSDRRINAQSVYETSPLALPFHYSPHSEHYQTLQTFLEQKLGISATGPIEYAEVKDSLLFSYYTQQESSFSNYFVNFGKDGAHSEVICLESGLTGFGKDTFMVWQHELVLCIQNRNILTIIDL